VVTDVCGNDQHNIKCREMNTINLLGNAAVFNSMAGSSQLKRGGYFVCEINKPRHIGLLDSGAF
jgi:hypothetical protein